MATATESPLKNNGLGWSHFYYVLFLTGPRTCGSIDRACLSERFICCRYGDNVNESQTPPRAGIRAVATETGSVPSCRKQQRKHAVSTVTLSTPEHSETLLDIFPSILHWIRQEHRVKRHMTPTSGCRWCHGEAGTSDLSL